jgi:hypothetical protein
MLEHYYFPKFQIPEFYNLLDVVRFQILTAVSMKMTVFWDVVPCGLESLTTFWRYLLPLSSV